MPSIKVLFSGTLEDDIRFGRRGTSRAEVA